VAAQEDKPAAAIAAEYLAHGYVLGDAAIAKSASVSPDIPEMRADGAQASNSTVSFSARLSCMPLILCRQVRHLSPFPQVSPLDPSSAVGLKASRSFFKPLQESALTKIKEVDAKAGVTARATEADKQLHASEKVRLALLTPTPD
jgi:hypothetical protein